MSACKSSEPPLTDFSFTVSGRVGNTRCELIEDGGLSFTSTTQPSDEPGVHTRSVLALRDDDVKAIVRALEKADAISCSIECCDFPQRCLRFTVGPTNSKRCCTARFGELEAVLDSLEKRATLIQKDVTPPSPY